MPTTVCKYVNACYIGIKIWFSFLTVREVYAYRTQKQKGMPHIVPISFGTFAWIIHCCNYYYYYYSWTLESVQEELARPSWTTWRKYILILFKMTNQTLRNTRQTKFIFECDMAISKAYFWHQAVHHFLCQKRPSQQPYCQSIYSRAQGGASMEACHAECNIQHPNFLIRNHLNVCCFNWVYSIY